MVAFSGAHVVVTGGTGALGSAVVARLRQADAVCHVTNLIAAELEIARTLPQPGCTPAEAQRYTRWLATHHYENFHVASWLLPARLRQLIFRQRQPLGGDLHFILGRLQLVHRQPHVEVDLVLPDWALDFMLFIMVSVSGRLPLAPDSNPTFEQAARNAIACWMPEHVIVLLVLA